MTQHDSHFAELTLDAAGPYILDLPGGDVLIPPPSLDMLRQWRTVADEPDHLFGGVQLLAVTGELYEQIKPHLSRPQVGAKIARDVIQHYRLGTIPEPYLLLLLDRFGFQIEADLHELFHLDLLDFFRGRYSWAKLMRLIWQIPPEKRFSAAKAMDREIAEALFKIPKPKKKPPLSPLGYSQEIHLLMSILESVRVLDNTLRRVHGNQSPAPQPLPRPVTAFQQIEREDDRDYVNGVLDRLGVKRF